MYTIENLFGSYNKREVEFKFNDKEYLAELEKVVLRQDDCNFTFVSNKEVTFYVGTPDEWKEAELTEELDKKLEEIIIADEKNQKWEIVMEY